MVWKSLTAALTMALIGGGVCSYTLYRNGKDLGSQLAAARADAQQATARAVSLQSQLLDQQAKLSDQREQLQSERAKITDESRPDLPIRVGFRRALLGQGEVAVFQNLSNRVLEITVDVQSPATGASMHRAYVMNRRGLLQIGPLEHWPFAPGQMLSVSNPAFRPIMRAVQG